MSLVYSTGPLNNETDLVGPPTQSKTVTTNILNNHKHTTITADIKVFSLQGVGTKVLIDSTTLTIPPNTQKFTATLTNTLVFEVVIKIHKSEDKNAVLIGVFGKDASGNLNPSHRLVHRELTRIHD
ncbi:hypothetical protein [Peribacillus loiseleuriae]|uniref:Uncharacterized protein n=1 Tax=Peribacillus loiseleuriae TaxID=1679170 RepID=A0A0K9G825_9BACI|nr:hypothetical protein [Peribacillus loiseleuriae]KMY42805.1 hypothetical protein AC625_24480 [Peribacillus loiseleuriae]KMY42808.1 hypothetical protein AC625_24500 [Peribacillus loiseleuriae]